MRRIRPARAWASTRVGVALVALCLGGTATAETVVLDHVTLFDGTGRAPRADQSLVMTDGRITWVGPARRRPAPTGAIVTDLRGKFLMPGLIDSHVHLGLVDGVDQSFTRYYDRANVEQQLKLYAAYGVTSVYTLGTDGDLIHQVIADQRRIGRIDMARAYTAGRGVVYKGSYGGVPGLEQSVATPAEATAMVRRETAKGDDFVKLWMDDEFGTVARRMPYPVSRAVIDAAHAAGRKAAAHIFYYDNAAELTRQGVDVFMHQVRDRVADPALATAMKRRGTWQLASTLSREASFTYTLLPFVDEPFFARGVAPATIATLKSAERRQKLAASPLFPKYPPVLRNAMTSLAAEARAGVRYGMGTDSGPTARFPGYFAHWELELMVAAGLTPLQALTAATGTNAGFLRENESGVLRPGKWADLLVLDRDPTRDIRNTRAISAVYVAGRKVPTIWETCVGRAPDACGAAKP
ncbi:amidohydrolase family protein [Sphingomonas endophytica]|uniref:Amidohydrolase n=1 Tax=Sphingomonas endophytica TaxID=869719 RepID=A0A147I6A9_9SPHN|nr:amidohydrolase family protein [Sphingomonas endophytica]KTT74402.1 amidohydrolase [Sphingomonas endophytica]